VEKAANPKNCNRRQCPSLFSFKEQVEAKEKIADARIPHLPKSMKPRFGPALKQRSFQD
jgi:hypothetical protein